MPTVDVTIFFTDAGEPGGTGVEVVLSGAQAAAETSAVSANQESNSVSVTLTGAESEARAGAIVAAGVSGDVFNPDFPRIAAGRIGTRNWGFNPTTGSGSGSGNGEAYEPEIEAMAKCHFSIINGQQYRGSGYVSAVEDWITRAEILNPDHIFYHYTDMQETGEGGFVWDKCVSETGPTGNGGTWTPNDWIVRDTTGEALGAYPASPSTKLTNMTTWVTPDSDGNYFPQWYANYETETQFDPHNYKPGLATPVRLNIYDDVNDPYTRLNSTDMNRNGVSDGMSNAHPKETNDFSGSSQEGLDAGERRRQGHRLYADRMRSNSAGMLYICNATVWNNEVDSSNPADLIPIWSYFENMSNGGWMEGQSVPPGKFPFSGLFSDGTTSSFGSFRRALNGYTYLMRHMLPPKHVMNQYGVLIDTGLPDELNPTVGDNITAASMTVARSAICQTLLDDGYVYITNDNREYNSTPHWDEFGTVNTSTTGLSKGWLGQPVDAAISVLEDASGQSAVWLGSDSNGIFKREFDNGIVLVNSSLTSSITIPVSAGADEANGELIAGKWQRINGAQDPSHNNGQVVNSNLTIGAHDGYVLQRV